MALILRQAGLQALATAITKLEIYTAQGGTKLLEFPSTEVVTATSITITSTTQTATATGTPTYAQLVDASNNVYVSGDVATTGTPWITLGAVTSGKSYQIDPNLVINAV